MRSVLVTGGSGFFGQAFVQRLLDTTGCNRIAVLSRSEHKQAEMADRFSRHRDRLRFFIGDVRDKERLRRAFDGIEVVVHAAALKRIEVGNYAPVEMCRTNVDGTVNVVEAAFDAHVKKVVFLSSDKAYQPVSPYGLSKALAESIVLNANNMSNRTDEQRPLGPLFAATRYGNVMGSAGSVIPRWRQILRTSDAVPVTDPSCTRFWMNISEAVDLVLETIRLMPTKSPVVPKLPAFSLGDLAAAMGAKMRITGLPDFEKRHEAMWIDNHSNLARRMSVEEIRGQLEKVH